jgi:F-type H+-transporting ATPase subunit epsilon
MAESKELTGTTGFEVRVVTPQGTAAETSTDAVTGPGRLGEFEVLPGHVPLLAELHPGVLALGGKKREYLAVGSGFLKVGTEGNIEVLVDQAVAASDVDVDAAKELLAEVGPKVDGWKDALDARYEALLAKRDWAQAQLDAHKMGGN